MRFDWIAAAALLVAAGAAAAQAAPQVPSQAPQVPQRVERAADLPRFTYAVQGELEAIVRDPQKFAVIAQQVRRDVESTLANYDIAELATRRSLLNTLAQLDLIEGRYDEALRRSNQIRELQEKPADKLLSGLSTRAIVAAVKKTGGRTTPAYQAEIARLMREELDRMPYAVVQNDVMRMRAGMETLGETRALGALREQLQPVAKQTGSLSSDLIVGLIGARFLLDYVLPLKETWASTYAQYLAANKVDKPDIWKARDVALPEGRNYAPVRIAVWDSGVDANVFPGRMLMDGNQPAMIAFDKFGHPSASPLKILGDSVQSRIDALQLRSKGQSDLTSNIDSPEAREVKTLLSTLAPEQYRTTQEELRLVSVYQHGTHVAGIAMEGNPYARLANARIDFGFTLLPDPCPTPELESRGAANFAKVADFIRKSGTRVVNMSWGGSLGSYEVELEQCNIGKDVGERKKIARAYFDEHYKALKAAFESLPDVLFVTSAGNSANDPTFNDAYPSGIALPNLVSIGAVDKAGDEAPFTSYGPTVVLHANGYQVESWVPGRKRLAISGTSMSAPQVTNLAAKMLAVKPSLKPAEVIDIMRKTADRSDDGRRTLVNPAKALSAVGYVP